MSVAVIDRNLPYPEPRGGDATRLRHVLNRSLYLQRANRPNRADMSRIRSIMDGGSAGMIALLGPQMEDVPEEDRLSIPAANLILSGTERAAHRLGRRPDLRVDPVYRGQEDKEGPRKAAEKRERIVEAYDRQSKMEMMLPQVARWLIGYGFAPLLVKSVYDPDGNGYPDVEIRDPFECWPAPWGVKQQPVDMAFVRRVPAETLAQTYPHAKDIIETRKNQPSSGQVIPFNKVGADSYGGWGHSQWENPTEDGIALVEYIDDAGCTVFSPQCEVILDHVPNPLRAGAPFVVLKRFAFNRLQGQFDQAIGLMASLAKINLLVQIAMEDAVFSPTNIYGTGVGADDYQIGRDAVNVFDNGTQVERPVAQLPYQLFQHVQMIERQLRQTSRYNAQDDGESPTSWATGKGLENLSAGTDAELRELRLVMAYGLEAIDAIRLEYDESRWPDARKPLVGERQGAAFSEDYVPKTHIKRSYRTRRVYGAMAGWDDATKIVTGLQLMQAKTMSRRTFMENVDGLENITREEKRIEQEGAREIAFGNLAMMAQQGDPAAMAATVEIMQGNDPNTVLAKYYTSQEPEMSPEEAALAQQPAMPEVPAQPEDVTTLLSRLELGGGVAGGAQTVGQI